MYINVRKIDNGFIVKLEDDDCWVTDDIEMYAQTKAQAFRLLAQDISCRAEILEEEEAEEEAQNNLAF